MAVCVLRYGTIASSKIVRLLGKRASSQASASSTNHHGDMMFSLFILLCVLAASANIPSVAAAQNQTEITTDELYATISTAPPPGFNVDGGSVFENYVTAVNKRQFFFIIAGSSVLEKPA